MKYKLIEDLADLSQIKPAVLNKLSTIVEFCICDYLDNLQTLDVEDMLEVDLGFGTLTLLYDDEEVRYQFKPSSKLEKNIVATLEGEPNVMVSAVECNLKRKVSNTYKELF